MFYFELFFCMLATIQDSEVSFVAAETNDGTAHMDQETDLKNVETAVVSENTTEVAAWSTRPMTDDQLLDISEDDSDQGDVSSDSSTHTVVPETFSDNDSDFNTDLPTKFAGQNQTPFAKDRDVESDKPETSEGKSAKTVLLEETIEIPEIETASKPL